MNHWRRREEDHRVVTAPAMRVLMRERFPMPQASALRERLDDLRVGIEHALAAEQLHGFEEVPGRSDRRVDLESVLHAGVEVVGAVTRRSVDGPGARVERDVVTEHAERRPRVERMLEADVFQLLALHLRDRWTERFPGDARDSRRERLRDDHGTSVDLVRRVVELGMERDRQVRRNRPRRRRPDQDRHGASREFGDALREFIRALGRERELHVDRRRRVILVFDFRFRERGAAVNAPVHRLLALVDQPLLDEPAERPRDGGLVAEIHRQVRARPTCRERRGAGTARS